MIQIYSDGSCIGNPGPGAAAWRILVDGALVADGSQGNPDTTNNRMELLAAVLALQDVLRLHAEGVLAPGAVEMRLDSQYTLGCLFDWLPGWKAKGFAKVKNVDLVQQLDEVAQKVQAQGFSLVKHWVKGHADDVHNNAVDVLAQETARAQNASSSTQSAPTPTEDVRPTAAEPVVTPHVDGIATMAIADMLLGFARQSDTTPEAFLAKLRALKGPLGL